MVVGVTYFINFVEFLRKILDLRAMTLRNFDIEPKPDRKHFTSTLSYNFNHSGCRFSVMSF